MLAIAFRRAIRLAALAALVPTLAGCMAPTQYQGPIAIDQAGLAERFRQLCARRVAAGATETACNTAELDE